MGEKDISTKMLEEYRDVFADIVNTLLFDGRRKVAVDSLMEVPGQRTQFKADDSKLHEQERDISKWWTQRNMMLSLIGLENQAKVDPDMPMRCISYDGASYKSQLLADEKKDKEAEKAAKKESKNKAGEALGEEAEKETGKTLDEEAEKESQKHVRYPVITLVLYFGKPRWTGPTTLSGMFEVEDDLQPYFSDYRINVFEIAHLPDEKIQQFTSDFRIVAEWCAKRAQTPN